MFVYHWLLVAGLEHEFYFPHFRWDDVHEARYTTNQLITSHQW